MTAPTKVPADLLDADMLYQRDAVLHEGMADAASLAPERRRVLHAVVSAAEGEVVACAGDGWDVATSAMATTVVHRAVADADPPRIVLVCPADAPVLPLGEDVPASFVERRWLEAGADAASELTFLATAADYLSRDIAEVDLSLARMGLRGRLDRINSARMILVNVVASGGDRMAVGLQVDRLAQLCGFGEDQEERLLWASRALAAVDEALDPIRLYEFWLAVHVRECAWLGLAREGEAAAPLRLYERVTPEGLPAAAEDERPIDLLVILAADGVDDADVRPLVRSSARTFVAGDAASAGPSSALALGLAACRWDFSVGTAGTR